MQFPPAIQTAKSIPCTTAVHSAIPTQASLTWIQPLECSFSSADYYLSKVMFDVLGLCFQHHSLILFICFVVAVCQVHESELYPASDDAVGDGR
jgi:hypothetical protein